MANEFDAEGFCRGLAMSLALKQNIIECADADGFLSEHEEEIVADFAARLRPHLADRRAVEGMREALAAAGEGE